METPKLKKLAIAVGTKKKPATAVGTKKKPATAGHFYVSHVFQYFIERFFFLYHVFLVPTSSLTLHFKLSSFHLFFSVQAFKFQHLTLRSCLQP